MPEGLSQNPDGSWVYQGRTFRAPDERTAQMVANRLAIGAAADAKKRTRMAKVTDQQRERVKQLLRFEEGILRRPTPVQGNPTLGIGRDLATKPLTETERRVLKMDAGRDFDRDPLTDAEADWLFEKDLQDAVNQAQNLVGPETYNTLDDARRATITSLTYQMGEQGIRGKFPRFLQAFQGGQYEDASKELLFRNPALSQPQPSLFSEQTPNRARRAAEMVRTGQLHPEVPGFSN